MRVRGMQRSRRRDGVSLVVCLMCLCQAAGICGGDASLLRQLQSKEQGGTGHVQPGRGEAAAGRTLGAPGYAPLHAAGAALPLDAAGGCCCCCCCVETGPGGPVLAARRGLGGSGGRCSTAAAEWPPPPPRCCRHSASTPNLTASSCCCCVHLGCRCTAGSTCWPGAICQPAHLRTRCHALASAGRGGRGGPSGRRGPEASCPPGAPAMTNIHFVLPGAAYLSRLPSPCPRPSREHQPELSTRRRWPTGCGRRAARPWPGPAPPRPRPGHPHLSGPRPPAG